MNEIWLTAASVHVHVASPSTLPRAKASHVKQPGTKALSPG